MGADAIRQTVIDPTDLDLRLDDLETAFDVGQGLLTFEDSGRRTESHRQQWPVWRKLTVRRCARS
jgi:hypothetical protein